MTDQQESNPKPVLSRRLRRWVAERSGSERAVNASLPLPTGIVSYPPSAEEEEQ